MKTKLRMSPTVDQLIKRFGLPAGYRRVTWAEVKPGQTVFIWGTRRDPVSGKPGAYAYGPHRIMSVAERRLRNPSLQGFTESQESLLLPI